VVAEGDTSTIVLNVMKAVILAAGEGKRMRPLTETVPKPMLHVGGKPILEHLLDVLPKEVDEIIFVIGYRGEKIKNHFKEKFDRFRIRYVEQGKPEGTARALALCKDIIGKERFFSLYADDLHGKDDFKTLVHHPLSALVKRVERPEWFGVVTLGEGNRIVRIVEKPLKPDSDLVVTGPAVLDSRIFEFEPPRHQNGEYFLAEAIGRLAEKHPVIAVEQSFWHSIATPEDLKKAEAVLSGKKKKKKGKQRDRKIVGDSTNFV